jgi:hypothetical protein
MITKSTQSMNLDLLILASCSDHKTLGQDSLSVERSRGEASLRVAFRNFQSLSSGMRNKMLEDSEAMKKAAAG